MKPIIKWPGGKSKEIEMIEPLIPSFDRYVEPFFGGGAVFFSLEPPKAEINDISRMLMTFYYLVKTQNEELHQLLLAYDRSFRGLLRAAELHYEEILSLYQNEELTETDLYELIERILFDCPEEPALFVNHAAYTEELVQSCADKFDRTKANHARKPFSDEDLKENLLTGFTSGFYLYFRDIFNSITLGRMLCSQAYEAANFYFIREFCYGSMFRYNARGEFNIPYGGISYNRKDFGSKVKNLFREPARSLFSQTGLHCEDFESFLDSLHLTEEDFIFLDPPYDTEFSEYEGRPFDKIDQTRLSDYLKSTPAQFILIIKNTEFIHGLYCDSKLSPSARRKRKPSGKELRILTFDKNYTYNVRSRNERAAEHLIITNIPEDKMITLHLE